MTTSELPNIEDAGLEGNIIRSLHGEGRNQEIRVFVGTNGYVNLLGWSGTREV